jgi:HD-GYP domain-containing protein (c-di-GMP phosphodiesterase class II)
MPWQDFKHNEVSAMDSQSSTQIITHYEDFLVSFFSLLQAIKIHDDNNRLVVDGIRKFNENLAYCMEEDSFTIKASKGFLFFEDEKLPYTKRSKHLIDNMVLYFDARNLEGLRFFSDIEKVSSRDIMVLMRGLETAGHEQDPIAWLTDLLDTNNLVWIEIIQKPKSEEEEEEDTGDDEVEIDQMRRERAKKDYTYVLASLKEIAKKVSEKKRVGIRKTVRVVQDIVSHIIEDDEIYTAISSLRVFDDYTFTHSVNVALLSMCIGKHVNFSRRSLERLGICALFHDLGKIEVPHEILNKPGKLDDTEFKLLQEHSLNSARLIVKLRASRDRKAKILLPPFEHHLKYNLSGYPYTDWQKPLTLFGRIIAIADVYDAITSERVYRKSAMSPDRALGLLLEGAGKDFDPILIKVFINMVGVYPVGTLLQLDNGDLALVVKSSRKKGERRPIVTLMKQDPDGTYQKGQTLDLAERDSITGNYVRGIAETYHPSSFGIQPVQHIFSEN